MGNNLNPPAIIFINNNISQGVLAQLVEQLAISEVQDAITFDAHIDGYQDGYMDENDGYGDGYISDNLYSKHQKGLGRRILVLRDLLDYTNRREADIVLSFRHGLVYVETNKFGPPGLALSLQNTYLQALMLD